jgi:hypothetical protein
MKPRCDPLFVGRQEESDRIRTELAAGKNLVLTGPFGIGRTAILRQVAWELREHWEFIFLSGAVTAGRMCRDLFLALFPQERDALNHREVSLAAQRRALAGAPRCDRRQWVVVLDDMAKATRQRVDFIRWLRGLGRFQVIAVTERFLPDEARQRLRVALAPAPLLALERLEPAMARAFFQAWSEQHRLGWGPDHVRGLVQATRGYPLGMREAVGATASAAPAED